MTYITLPALPAPNGASVTLIDYGLTLRPATGAAVQRISRAGSRFRIDVTFPPMVGETARVFISRLIRAKRVGTLRLKYPLLDVDQGEPGSPVMDGAANPGTTIAVRGMTPGYEWKEGYLLSILDAAETPYLHMVMADGAAAGNGKGSILVDPPLRHPFSDGATILLQQPVIEGFVDGPEWAWTIDVAHHYGLAVSIEEAA